MYTVEFRDVVRNAIQELVEGKRVVKISFNGLNGSTHTNEYAQVHLPELRRLLHEVERSLRGDDWEYEEFITRKF